MRWSILCSECLSDRGEPVGRVESVLTTTRWHGTILAKLAMVPQSLFNAYVSGPHADKGQYKEGDLVASFPGCDKEGRSCVEEQKPFFEVLDRKKQGYN
jgi:hypothetical protein